MNCWLEKGIHYWEGAARPQAIAIQVPQRPSPDHVWDGKDWVDNTAGYYAYDKASLCWILKAPEEIATIDTERTKTQVLAENMELAKMMKVLLLELDAIRKAEPRPQEMTDFIECVKDYL